MTYAAMIWDIGLRFTREALLYLLRALPPILASVIALILICATLSWLLAWAPMHLAPI